MSHKILIIDDDPMIIKLLESILKMSEYQIRSISDSTCAMDEIISFMPDIILLDLMMPVINGFDITRQVKEDETLKKIKIIIISAKQFEFDQNRTIELGADYYITKPFSSDTISSLSNTIDTVLADSMKITFWGTRETIPTPELDMLKYGGHTSCVSVELTKERIFVFDAGTGITKLGEYLIKQKRRHKLNLFITHPHWDHIHGFPFFKVLYTPGNEMAVHGSSHGGISLRDVMSGQMKSIHFPVTLKEFASLVYFEEISEGEYNIEGITVNAINLNHPGITLGYRLINSNDKSMAYITDNELVPNDFLRRDTYNRDKLVKFLKNTDVLIHDSSYFDSEYLSRTGWGHSPVTEVLKLAEESEVKTLCLFHHDSDHDDSKVAEMEEFGRNYFNERGIDIECVAAIEGESICL